MRTLSVLAVVAAVAAGCRSGSGLPESLAREVAACDAGDMTSCENAAGAFENGTGVTADPTRAADLRGRLVTLATDFCDRGRAHGCSYLGRAYVEGIGVAAARERGIALLRRGCAGGDPLACTYLENLGVPPSSSSDIGPEPAEAPAPLFEEIEKRAGEAERKLREDLRNRPK